MRYQNHLGDYLQVIKSLPSASVDSIICDPPYGTTKNAWDQPLDWPALWPELWRVCRSRSSPVVLFSAQPFTAILTVSALQEFKWEDIWRKSHATGHLNCKVMPMRQHENILVFGRGKVTYNPQLKPKPRDLQRSHSKVRTTSTNWGKFNPEAPRSVSEELQYPKSVIEFDRPTPDDRGMHPTQKPVPLMEYLVLTYSNAGDTILDFTQGSGSTGVAALNHERRYIGIERDPSHHATVERRLASVAAQSRLFGATA